MTRVAAILVLLAVASLLILWRVIREVSDTDARLANVDGDYGDAGW